MARSKKRKYEGGDDASSAESNKRAQRVNYETRGPNVRQTRGASRDASVKAVMNTTELLENILLHLPMKKIFLIQCVCRHFKEVIAESPSIQEKLWLRLPKAQSSAADPGASRKALINPLLMLRRSHEHRFRSPSTGDCHVRGIVELQVPREMVISKDDRATWRNMLPMAFPVYGLNVRMRWTCKKRLGMDAHPGHHHSRTTGFTLGWSLDAALLRTGYDRRDLTDDNSSYSLRHVQGTMNDLFKDIERKTGEPVSIVYFSIIIKDRP